jgi:hypothetical protein
MESKIANAISLNYQPVALIWSDQEPAEAVQFQQGKWGCIMWLAACAAKGKAAACDRKTFGCFGGVVGMGFGDQFLCRSRSTICPGGIGQLRSTGQS